MKQIEGDSERERESEIEREDVYNEAISDYLASRTISKVDVDDTCSYLFESELKI